MNDPEYIRNNMDTPNKELAEELGRTDYYIRLCKEVKRKPSLWPNGENLSENDDFLELKKVANLIDKSVRMVREHCSNGEMKCKKARKKWLIPKEEVGRLLQDEQ